MEADDKHSGRLRSHRSFFADLVTAAAGVRDERLVAAFASTPRERFIGPGPWRVFTPLGYIDTPSSDPAFLYQDIVVALAGEGTINNGQPSLHAACLAALNVQEGEAVVHVGAGTGYYTALLSRLAGSTGRVFAYELEPGLASRAAVNLADQRNVMVHHRSGSEGPLPTCDVVYVNAGATAPLDVWLDALRPEGRLLFPLTPAEGFGGMLLLTHQATGRYAARFVSQAMFIPCVGARDEETARRLSEAFQRDDLWAARSLHRRTPPNETCSFAGQGWWLSSAGVE